MTHPSLFAFSTPTLTGDMLYTCVAALWLATAWVAHTRARTHPDDYDPFTVERIVVTSNVSIMIGCALCALLIMRVYDSVLYTTVGDTHLPWMYDPAWWERTHARRPGSTQH